MNQLPPFEPFTKIPRYNRDVWVSEKIDGTNAVVYVTEDGEVHAGSRTRWITPEADNFGFAAWVRDNSQELRKLGPGTHRGEWWGRGIQRGYGLTERRFSLFNVGRWHEAGKHPVFTGEKFDPVSRCSIPVYTEPAPACCHVVPVLYFGPWEHMPEPCGYIWKGGSLAAPGFPNPEGIIIYHVAGNQYFKYTLDGDGHKGGGK